MLIVLLLCFFGVLYSQTTLTLPLFGDATIHGANAIDVLIKGWTGLEAEYPAFYSYTMALFYPFFGEKGFNMIPFIGFIFLLGGTFLFIRQLTKNYYLGLLSIILVGCSPKIIFYSARMYQEILIGAFFIFCIYLLFHYVETKKRIFLILLAFFVGITLSIKQQGLFILYPTIILFFIIYFLKEKIFRKQIANIAIIILFPLVIGMGFYGVLFHTTGKLQPGSNEFTALEVINTFGQKLFSYQKKDSDTGDETLERALMTVETKYSKLAFKRAEERHIWPTDVFTDFDRFNQANNLYIPFQGITGNIFVTLALCIGLIGGFIYCLFHYKKYQDLLLFSFVFLPINYLLFVRNSDQQRYHLFVPIFLLAFVLVFFQIIFRRLHVPITTTLLITIPLMLLLFLPLLVPRILLNTRWSNSQLYSPSEGGIASIKEAGQWMQKKSNPTTIVGQQCNNETHYYFQRPVVGDWRIYFLDPKNLQTYFMNKNISYYVIYTSQIVKDNEWVIICWVPESFYKRMEENYDRVYTTQSEDVIIYQVHH